MLSATAVFSIFHENGLLKSGDSILPPILSAKNQRQDAVTAPVRNPVLLPPKLLPMLPRRTTVSR